MGHSSQPPLAHLHVMQQQQQQVLSTADGAEEREQQGSGGPLLSSCPYVHTMRSVPGHGEAQYRGGKVRYAPEEQYGSGTEGYATWHDDGSLPLRHGIGCEQQGMSSSGRHGSGIRRVGQGHDGTQLQLPGLGTGSLDAGNPYAGHGDAPKKMKLARGRSPPMHGAGGTRLGVGSSPRAHVGSQAELGSDGLWSSAMPWEDHGGACGRDDLEGNVLCGSVALPRMPRGGRSAAGDQALNAAYVSASDDVEQRHPMQDSGGPTKHAAGAAGIPVLCDMAESPPMHAPYDRRSAAVDPAPYYTADTHWPPKVSHMPNALLRSSSGGDGQHRSDDASGVAGAAHDGETYVSINSSCKHMCVRACLCLCAVPLISASAGCECEHIGRTFWSILHMDIQRTCLRIS